MPAQEHAWDMSDRHVAAGWRYLVAVLLALHGGIHVLGFAATWGLGRVNGISRIPMVSGGLEANSPVVALLGVLWLAAALGFLAAAVGVAMTAGWWRISAAATALLSLVLCVAWWNDARAGVVIDVAILAGLAIVAWSTSAREA